ALAVWGFGWESEGEIPARRWQADPEGTPPAPPGADVYRELGPTLLGSIWTERTWPLSKFTEQENLYRPSEMSRSRMTSIVPTTQSLRPGLSSMRVFRNSTRRPRKRLRACRRFD